MTPNAAAMSAAKPLTATEPAPLLEFVAVDAEPELEPEPELAPEEAADDAALADAKGELAGTVAVGSVATVAVAEMPTPARRGVAGTTIEAEATASAADWNLSNVLPVEGALMALGGGERVSGCGSCEREQRAYPTMPALQCVTGVVCAQ